VYIISFILFFLLFCVLDAPFLTVQTLCDHGIGEGGSYASLKKIKKGGKLLKKQKDFPFCVILGVLLS